MQIILAFLNELCYHPYDIEKAMIGPSCTDQHRFSECGMVGAAWAQYGAFSRELPSESCSRNGRVTPLTVLSVFALKESAVRRIAGGTAEGSPFVPIYGMKGYFL